MEELGGLGRIEAFQKQSPEADAVFGVARIPRNERFKGSLRFLIAVLFPKRFGLSESWRRSLRREGGGRAQDGQQESHLSSPSWVWANWSKSTPSCFLYRSEEHTSELLSPCNLVCRLLLEKKRL